MLLFIFIISNGVFPYNSELLYIALDSIEKLGLVLSKNPVIKSNHLNSLFLSFSIIPSLL